MKMSCGSTCHPARMSLVFGNRQVLRPRPSLRLKPLRQPERIKQANVLTTAISSRLMKLAIAAAALLFIAITALVALRGRSDSGLNRFWGPIFEPSTPVLICVGAVDATEVSPQRFSAQIADAINGTAELPDAGNGPGVWPAVSWTDAVEMTRIAAMLSRHDKRFLLRSSKNVTLADLRNGPVIMLGVLEN